MLTSALHRLFYLPDALLQGRMKEQYLIKLAQLQVQVEGTI